MNRSNSSALSPEAARACEPADEDLPKASTEPADEDLPTASTEPDAGSPASFGITSLAIFFRCYFGTFAVCSLLLLAITANQRYCQRINESVCSLLLLAITDYYCQRDAAYRLNKFHQTTGQSRHYYWRPVALLSANQRIIT